MDSQHEAPRFASLDIGSNTVKLTIVERQPDGVLAPIVDRGYPTRLGEGISARRLRESAMRRTLDALRDALAECGAHDVQGIAAVGTSALRDATNRDQFLARARTLGVTVEVITGEQEARLSFQAVKRDPLWANSERVFVVDVGGGSTELIAECATGGGRLGRRVSLQLGAVRLTESQIDTDPPSVQQISAAIEAVDALLARQVLPTSPYVAVGVGGTFTNLAGVFRAGGASTTTGVHGTVLSLTDIEEQIRRFVRVGVDERRGIPGLDPARADIIIAGALIVSRVMLHAKQEHIHVSARGLRWGLMYDRFGVHGAS